MDKVKPGLVGKLPENKKIELKANEEAAEFRLTDLGNAQRLISQHGQNLRYCSPWNKWLVFDGQRWVKDETGLVKLLAMKTVRNIHIEAANAISKDLAGDLSRHALRSESAQKLKAMVEVAQSLPGVPVVPDQLDTDPWLLNVQNGTLDLKTGELRKHKREDLTTKMAPVKYNPEARAPTWESFLKRIMDGNMELISFLQLAIGYSLTGSIREQVLFFLYGSGANGKSTFLDAIGKMLGDYALYMPAESLMVKRYEGIPNDIAMLKGARFVTAIETEDGRRLAESQVKQLTGGDKITARFMRGEFFSFRPDFKLFLAANHKPVIRGTDNAIWRRIRLIPFSVKLPEEEWDRDLPSKLHAELPGILNWSLEGCVAWQHIGLVAPGEVKIATEGYRAEMDTMAGFIEEYCTVKPYAKATAGSLYAKYCEWATANGEKVESQSAFGRRLTERGFNRLKGTAGMRFWEGIGLKDQPTKSIY